MFSAGQSAWMSSSTTSAAGGPVAADESGEETFQEGFSLHGYLRRGWVCFEDPAGLGGHSRRPPRPRFWMRDLSSGTRSARRLAGV